MRTFRVILSLLAVVALAAIIVLGCGGSSGNGSTTATTSSTAGGTGTTSGTPATVQMTGTHTFNPTTVTVAAGSVVTWNNPDVTNHTVTSDTNLAGFGSDTQFAGGLPTGSSYSFTVPSSMASGTVIYYHCRFHGTAGNGSSIGTGMAGSITVK